MKAVGARGRAATVLAAAALAAPAMLTGCASEPAAADAATDGIALRLVIPDANIRQPDVPCSGARGFRFAHPGTSYAVEDPDGREVATGELPEGVAEQAFTFDMGDARQPTVCVMTLQVADVASLDGHALVIADRTALPIRPNVNLDHIPEVVLQ